MSISKPVSSVANGTNSLFKRFIYTIDFCLIAVCKPVLLQNSLYLLSYTTEEVK